MNTFDHEGKNFISIKGKDYFLLRGYQKNYGKFIFIQVTGTIPLHKEDLPTKEWEILRSKAGGERAWTAYIKSYFNYNTERANPVLAFLGGSTEGSYFITLKYISKRFNLNIENEEIHKVARRYTEGKLSNYHLSKESDLGNSEVSLLIFDFGYGFDVEDAKRILKGE